MCVSIEDKMKSRHFEVGDFFSESIRYWEMVISVYGDNLTTLNMLGEIDSHTIEDFISYASYSSIDGYWIDYEGNNDSRTEEVVQLYLNKLLSNGDRDDNIDFILLKDKYEIFNIEC